VSEWDDGTEISLPPNVLECDSSLVKSIEEWPGVPPIVCRRAQLERAALLLAQAIEPIPAVAHHING
jgi:hypothetical protein